MGRPTPRRRRPPRGSLLRRLRGAQRRGQTPIGHPLGIAGRFRRAFVQRTEIAARHIDEVQRGGGGIVFVGRERVGGGEDFTDLLQLNRVATAFLEFSKKFLV